MPHFHVRVAEEDLTPEVETRLIHELTQAAIRVYGDWACPIAHVELHGSSRRRIGVGGAPTQREAPSVTMNIREEAFHRPDFVNGPAQLFAAITDAVVAVFGESVRPHVTVQLVGIPAARSGASEVVAA
ncbi:hypothetical protein [Streptomyces oceani]|uniref:4-oxalocrotonate tautomerase domain-containing protein n=1 Tax=Streptomyces oceani TaxID=1075402 RepID=A0A1E7KLD2_9ACTN|nr:hypothetical protein [Streptomyces oceani]OEV04769.1 hypothetical protein AN216_05705 [Streptomyces oceani]